MKIKVTSFRKIEKKTLKGFINVELTDVGLEIRDCALHQKGNERWIGLPARPYTKGGQTCYASILRFGEGHYQDFQAATLEALRKGGYLT